MQDRCAYRRIFFVPQNDKSYLFGRCLRPALSAHTAQALATARYPLLSLTQKSHFHLAISTAGRNLALISKFTPKLFVYLIERQNKKDIKKYGIEYSSIELLKESHPELFK